MTFSVDRQQVVVVGAGASGRAAASLLVTRGARVTLADTAAALDVAPHLAAEGVSLALGPHDPALFAAADLLVVSPGVPLDQPAIRAARDRGVPVIGELELAFRWLAGRVIAITGTKGKSTTTTLAARMLAEAGVDAPAGGNLGVPLSAQVAGSRPDTWHVVEVSSFQLETTDLFHPRVAVLLNLTPDHLDRHGTFEAYRDAKARIFRNQSAEDWAIVNADDPDALALARGGRARRLDFALDAPLGDGVTVEGDAIVRRRAGEALPLMPLRAVSLPGRHLLGDVLAAAAVGCVVGVPPGAMRRAVEGFHGLPHALERVGVAGGVRFVNDSKATNIAAARRSLESFETGIVAIMGGRFKGGRFEDLRDLVSARVRAIVAIGEARPLIHAAFGDQVEVRDAVSMPDAVGEALALARPSGVVLLAPACASFDMFRDYADRGQQFRDAVARVIDEEEPAGTSGRGSVEP
jgi:UDP-N-acetylmuramoylalanine--D-glutamate ligase